MLIMVGKWIRRYRKIVGLTQEGLERLAKISSVNAIENGKRTQALRF
jgi:transcriptional regulator with XRE-family HTH domain